MSQEVLPPSNNDSSHGLPPVKPPSARFIVQLFLIPGLIVAGLVLVFVFGGLAWVGTSSPEAFLVQIDNPNPDVRWRAAHELAQVLQRPESLELASDPDFALDIAERLIKANQQLNEAEKEAKTKLLPIFQSIDANTSLTKEQKIEQQNQASVAAWNKLASKRDLVVFLENCLGHFTVPVGVPALGQIARMNDGPEIKSMALRKQRAVLALANLGDNMKRHYYGIPGDENSKVLTETQKTVIRTKLAKAATDEGERGAMARYCQGVLDKKIPDGVDIVMAECANHEDIFLRELVALALNFWDGDLVEPTLLKLANDQGQGRRIPDIN